MKLAYLASDLTLPGSPRRDIYAFEHDQMMAALRGGFEEGGGEVYDIAWDAPEIAWSEFDCAMIGSTWDYCARQAQFIETLSEINTEVPVLNSPQIAEWNSHKSYLRDLEMKGTKLIPTLWYDDPKQINWDTAFDMLETDELVVKRQIGANADGQFRLKRGDTPPMLCHPVMAQPFFNMICEEGELSFIFIDNDFCHALVKRPAKNDYRSQANHGAREFKIDPSKDDLAVARAVLDNVEDRLLYARVDMLRNEKGVLCLMELELVEPFLYPLQGPELGERLYKGLTQRV